MKYTQELLDPTEAGIVRGTCECHPGQPVIGFPTAVQAAMFRIHHPKPPKRHRVYRDRDGLWVGAGGHTYSTWQAAVKSTALGIDP